MPPPRSTAPAGTPPAHRTGARTDPRLDWLLARSGVNAPGAAPGAWLTLLWFLRPDLTDTHPDWQRLLDFARTHGVKASHPVPAHCPLGARVLRVRVPLAALAGLQAQPAVESLLCAMPHDAPLPVGTVAGAALPERLPPVPPPAPAPEAGATPPPPVALAVIDDACPWMHPALAHRDDPARTRLRSLRALAPADAADPADRCWNGAGLDAARRTPDLLARADAARATGLPLPDGLPPVPTADAHGVPVWQLAAGHGATSLSGLGLPDTLPDLPLHAVLLSPGTVADLGGGALTGELVDALRGLCAAQDPAAALVVTASYGLHAGPHRPPTADLLARIDPLVKSMEAHLPWDREDLPNELMEGWQMFSLTLASYRREDFSRAESWARRCLRHPNVSGSRNAAARAVMAMALHRNGHPEDARTELETARSQVEENFNGPFQLWTGQGHWFDWMIARILVREADQVLKD